MKLHGEISFFRDVLIFFALINIFMVLIFYDLAFPWGSLTGANTHGLINNEAYNAMKSNTYIPKYFPDIDKILANEGVYLTGEGGPFGDKYLSGPGPDSEGSTIYSEHYYNPRTGKGNAPSSVKKYFIYLAKANLEGGRTHEIGPKSAAWAAHFLADMFVPYHIVGMPARDAITLKASGRTPVKLSGSDAGDIKSLGAGFFIGGTKKNMEGDFTEEMDRFLKVYAGSPHMDWFDPWYWNGWSMVKDKTCTHLGWEAWAHPKISDISYVFSGFSKHFENTNPSFDNPVENQANKIEEMTKLSAQETVIYAPDYINNPYDAIREAITAVLTMWRASYSALEPNFSIVEKDSKWKIEGRVKNNELSEKVDDVKVEFEINRNGKTEKDQIGIGNIPAGRESGILTIDIDPEYSGDIEVRIKVIGRYKQTPDLQYAEQFLKSKITHICTYQYSDWTSCDPVTKKETRQVISKLPYGCIEVEKPELERDCEPEEDTNKQKADKLWNECIELAKIKQYGKALQKCEESLTYWSDEKRIKATNQLREQVNKEEKNLNNNVINVINSFLKQFDDTCFGKVISIGNPSRFAEALSEGNVTIKHSPKEPPRLVTYKPGLFSVPKNELRVPFDPQNPQPTYQQQLALYHESVHQIEALRNAIRDNKEPGAERNTDYAQNIVQALKHWASLEMRMIKKEPISDETDLVEELGNLAKEIEDNKLKYNPDKEIKVWVGFDVDFNKILNLYLSGECGDKLKKIAEEYKKRKAPTCTYNYSDWSPCDPKTKKQTRKVVSKSPERCIDKEKPEIERACKPEEDTNKQKADKLWNECIELAKANQYEKALQKCEESLTYWSEGKRLNAINQLREQVSKDKIAQEEKEKAEKEKIERERIERDRIEREKIEREKLEQEKREREERERIEQEKRERERRESEKKEEEEDKKKVEETPTCSYEYSDWGECSRATKKQTRTVIAKKPERCIERQKPVLEQGCTPPPTEEEKRISLLNCICRCGSGIIGAHYHPEPVKGASISCDDLGNGPCMGGDWGCFRWFLPIGGECVEKCYKERDIPYDKSIILVENKRFMKPLKLGLKVDKCPIYIQFGDVITFSASAEGGIPPYKFSWSGEGEAKDNQFIFAKSRQVGNYPISVNVSDNGGNTATVTCNIIVEAMKVKLTMESPKEKTLPIGSKANLIAEVLSGDKPASGTFYYQWQPHPEVVFGDPKNLVPETKEGAQSRNTALFKRTGNFKIWVDVFKEIEGRKVKVGESEQIPINVVNPKLNLKVSKTDPLVGDKVVVTVQEEPKMSDEFVSFWWEYSGNIDNPGVEPNIPNSRAYSFKPKDTKPVTITIHAKAKDGGDDLGEAKITITAKSYQVSISQPRYLGPKPRIWKCDTQLGGACPGLVEVADTQFAVFRDIFMKATVTPTPESPRYRWSIDPSGSCGFPGAGDEIKLNCSQTGTYTVKVEVTNADGIKLGEATQTVTVSISDEMLKQADKSKQAYDKVQQAKQLVGQGKLDEAINLSQEAVSLDPKNQEAKSLSDKWKKDRDSINKNIENANKLINNKKFIEAEKEINQAKALHPKYAKVIEAEKILNEEKNKYQREVTNKINEAKRLLSEKKIDEAVSLIKEVAKIDKTTAQPLMNQISQEAKNIGWDALHHGDYKLAIKRLEQAIELNPLDTDAQKKLKEAKDYQAKMPMIEAKMKEFDQLVAEKKIVSSYQKLLEIQDILRSIGASGQSSTNPVIIKYNKDYNELNKWYNELIQKTNTEWTKLFQQKDWISAEKLLTEVLKYEHTEANRKNYESSLQMVRNFIAEERNKKQRADQLWDECITLTKQNRHAEALSKCKESLNISPDEKRRQALAQLEQEVARKQKADELWNQCIVHAKQNRITEAVSLCEQSLTYHQREDRQRALTELKAAAKKAEEEAKMRDIADRLWSECINFAKANKLNEAVAKCEESIRYQSREDRLKALSDLRAAAMKAQQEAQNKQTADKLWSECIELARQKNYEQAWQKCDESLKYWRNDQRIEATAKLKEEARRSVTTPTLSDQSSGRDYTYKTEIQSKVFEKPMHKGKRLDWCQFWAQNCGKGAADAFCQSLGYSHSESFEMDPDIGHITPTIVIGTDQICNESFCDGFKYIKCAGPTPPVTTSQKPKVIFNNGNIAGVYNNPTRATTFTINQPYVITLIQNYHWNNARGSTPGTIALRDQSGRTYGPWQAKGSPGQGGVPNAYWTVYPNITLPAGTYTVIDSEPSTWAQNSGSGGAGHTRVEGYPLTETGNQQIGNTIQQERTINAELTNNSRENVHIFVEGQDTFGPHNRITPNERKIVTIKAPAQAGFINFVAGRNGQVLAKCRWEYVPDYQNRVPVVRFSDLNILSCSTGLR